MKSSKLVTQFIAIVITVLAGVAFAAANNWTAPTATPPGGNVDAPINVSGTAQEKTGGLILGSGLVAGQPALVLPTGDLLIGTTLGQAAPNGGRGNIAVNDVYITSLGKWASTLQAPAPTPAPIPEPACVNTTWSPDPNTTCIGVLLTQTSNCGNTRATNGTLNDSSCQAPPAPAACVASADTCYSMVGGQCDSGYYLSGSTSCCALDACKAYTASKWINDKLAINYVQADPDGSWGTVQRTSFTTKYPIDAIRIRGNADDGGYCYAYWGTGHIATTRHDGTVGIYNVNNQYYDGSSSGGAGKDATPLTTGTGKNQTIVMTGTGKNATPAYAPVTYNTCPTNPPLFTDTGTAQLCQLNYGWGAMTTITRSFSGRSIPAGTTITLQGSHTIGNASDYINCGFDIQYAP